MWESQTRQRPSILYGSNTLLWLYLLAKFVILFIDKSWQQSVQLSFVFLQF